MRHNFSVIVDSFCELAGKTGNRCQSVKRGPQHMLLNLAELVFSDHMKSRKAA